MDVLNEIVFEVVKEKDRKSRFTTPVDAPLGEAYEVAGMCMDEVVRLITAHNEKRKEANEASKEKPKEE